MIHNSTIESIGFTRFLLLREFSWHWRRTGCCRTSGGRHSSIWRSGRMNGRSCAPAWRCTLRSIDTRPECPKSTGWSDPGRNRKWSNLTTGSQVCPDRGCPSWPRRSRPQLFRTRCRSSRTNPPRHRGWVTGGPQRVWMSQRIILSWNN